MPSGSLVIPSFYNSLHDPEVYPEPDKFYPERWLDQKGLANSNPKNYLVFGSGPHKCIGLEYAQMNIALALATAVAMMNFEHELTPLSNKVEYVVVSLMLGMPECLPLLQDYCDDLPQRWLSSEIDPSRMNLLQ